jgi:hypothetical protein
MKKKLVTERKIPRRIFGPTTERDGTWRIKTNDELNNLIKNEGIINYIKVQRLSWFGHIYRTKSDRMVKNYVNGNRFLQD